MRDGTGIDRLLTLMAQLRHPERGCVWDVAQTFATIAPYTVEEAYEVADAIERNDMLDLRDELGDLLLQVVFHARMAEEAGLFAFADVTEAIRAKLVRRHPHVFDAAGALLPESERVTDPRAIDAAWKRIKLEERAEKTRAAPTHETAIEEERLGGVPKALPALNRARKISTKAASYGFDWPNAREVIAKVREEVDEVEESLTGANEDAVSEEIGDLLFAVANLARHAGVDPEAALHRGVGKFQRRFEAMARRLEADGSRLTDHKLAAMEAAWQAVKRSER